MDRVQKKAGQGTWVWTFCCFVVFCFSMDFWWVFHMLMLSCHCTSKNKTHLSTICKTPPPMSTPFVDLSMLIEIWHFWHLFARFLCI
jgi:hypothetical protein